MRKTGAEMGSGWFFQHHGMAGIGAFIFALGYEVSGLGRRIAFSW